MLPVDHPDIELIFRQTVGRGVRSLCIAAAQSGEGATAVATALARRCAAAGCSTLLFDTDVVRGSAGARFLPGQSRWPVDEVPARAAAKLVPRYAIHVLPAPTGGDPYLYRDDARLRSLLSEDLRGFDAIVVDTSPLLETGALSIPPEVVAAACDATVLVVAAGVTSELTLRAAVDRLLTAEVRLCGTILNSFRAPTVAEELCRRLDRFARFSPRAIAKLQRALGRSTILNMQRG